MWISAKTQMPQDLQYVIVAVNDNGDKYTTTGRYNEQVGWEWPYEEGAGYWEPISGEVLFWMPWPEYPES